MIISKIENTINRVSSTGMAVGWDSCTGEFHTNTNKIIAISCIMFLLFNGEFMS